MLSDGALSGTSIIHYLRISSPGSMLNGALEMRTWMEHELEDMVDEDRAWLEALGGTGE